MSQDKRCSSCDYPIPDCRCMKPRYVVCAANKSTKTGRIVCGARYWDSVMRNMALYVGADGKRKMTFEWQNCKQGFIDQYGQWMDREEALLIAKANGQVKYQTDPQSKELFSEDLY